MNKQQARNLIKAIATGDLNGMQGGKDRLQLITCIEVVEFDGKVCQIYYPGKSTTHETALKFER